MPLKTPFGNQDIPPDSNELTPEEAELMAKIAAKVIQWQMAIPAIMFLESMKPLNWIGSQAMVFFEPFVSAIFNVRQYNIFRGMMERRENMERLLQKIEELDAIAQEKEQELKKIRKAEKKARRKKLWNRLLRRKNADNTQAPGDKS
jgi:hypothetical protein